MIITIKTSGFADIPPSMDAEAEFIKHCALTIKESFPDLSEIYLRGFVVATLLQAKNKNKLMDGGDIEFKIDYETNPFADNAIDPEFFHGQVAAGFNR